MSYSIRKATLEDVAVIAYQRMSMFQDIGLADETLLKRMDAPFRAWVSERLQAGLYHGWLAVNEREQVIAGAGLWLLDWIPSPLAPIMQRGYILNVFTERAYRRQGIARALIEAILDECRAQGRPIYEALGFEATNEMRIQL